MAPSVRTTVNVLSFLMTAAVLGILIYVVANLKSFLTRALDLGISVVESRRGEIQASADQFVSDTATNVLNNQKVMGLVDNKMTKTTQTILKDPGVEQAMGKLAQDTIAASTQPMKAALASAIKSDEVTGALKEVIDKQFKESAAAVNPTGPDVPNF